MFISSSLTVSLAVIVSMASLLYGLFVYLAKARGKRISLVTFLVFVATVLLFCLDQMVARDVVTLVVSVPDGALRFVAFLGAAFIVLKALDLLLVEAVLIDKQDLYLPPILRMVLIVMGLMLTGVFLVHQVMGINVIALIAVPTVLTAIVGFALKDTLSRVASGVMLGQLMHEGDWVTLSGREGRVADISLGQVTLHNRAGDAVMLPNDLVCAGVIENHNRPVVLHASTLLVEAALVHPPREVIRVLEDAARAVDGVHSDPQPVCHATHFKGAGIEYELNFWFEDFTRRRRLESDVLTYVWHALRRNGIESPYSSRPPSPPGSAEPASLSPDGLRNSIRQLRGIDFLGALADTEMESLAKNARVKTYLPGESVVQRGAQGEELFIVSAGQASVLVDAEGTETEVARLGVGEFFGEMSLLTGDPRSATVKAVTDLSLLVLDKAAMRTVFQHNQELIEQVGRVVQHRKADLAVKREAKARVEAESHTGEEGDLIDRIRDFFGL
jgi:small-conductance mechanosensitive channel/CRP-like cAMP-binding protein